MTDLLDNFPPEAPPPLTKIITLEGTARSGKGTCGSAIASSLVESGRSVLSIDQGIKFRSLTRLALDKQVDFSKPEALDEFLGADETSPAMLTLLDRLNGMSHADQQAVMYSGEIGGVVGQIGARPASHHLAVSLMYDQVRQANADKTDTVLIDGRALEKYGRRMHEAHIGIFTLSYYFQCDSLTAARRVRKVYGELSQLTTEQKLALLDEAEKIRKRNDSDARRETDPMRYPDHAYDLDLIRGLGGKVWDRDIEQIAETRIISANTSHATLEQMVRPVVDLASYMLRLVDKERAAWQLRGGPNTRGVQLIPESS